MPAVTVDRLCGHVPGAAAVGLVPHAHDFLLLLYLNRAEVPTSPRSWDYPVAT